MREIGSNVLQEEKAENNTNSGWGDHQEFMALMHRQAEQSSQEDITKTITAIERMVKHPDRNIDCYTDPGLSTFCCAEVPARRVDAKGNIIEDPDKKQYLVGVPFLYVAGQAPNQFFRGEIHHEVGHALYTDWTLMDKFRQQAMREGYDPREILDLNNCVEDPRMERVAGGPIHPGIQADLFEKNRLLIIPSIASGMTQMTPPEQFRFLTKLEGLWNIYGQEVADLDKPWDVNDLHPEVQAAYRSIESDLLTITGDARQPAVKLSKKYERIFIDKIWPVYKGLIDAFPDQSTKSNESNSGQSDQGDSNESDSNDREQDQSNPADNQSGGENKDGNDEGDQSDGASNNQEPGSEGDPDQSSQQQSGESDESGQSDGDKQSIKQEGKSSQPRHLKRGATSQSGQEGDPEGDSLDPHDPSTWPPQLQKFLQHMQQQHQSRLEQQAAQVKAELERQKGEFSIYKKSEHELLKRQDGFEDPQAREKYQQLAEDISPTTDAIARLFKRFFPKTEEPEEEWGRRGKRVSVQRLARHHGTGRENPLGKKEMPQETKFLLQIIVDVSGSMYGDGPDSRITNAIKGCIALAEAAEKTNVDVEILASDDSNVSSDDSYLIKAFDDKFFGPTKEKIISMLSRFGGGNDDAASVIAAIDRLKSAVRKAKTQADRVGSLVIFISDSTSVDADMFRTVEAARAITPLEGFAITSEAEVVECVKKNFGPDSIVPKSVPDLPEAMRQIIQRNINKFAIK